MLELEPPLTVQSVIILTGAGWWSEAALEMLADNGVPVYSLRQNGEVNWLLTPAPHLRGGRLGPSKPGLIRLQATLLESDIGITLAKNLITEKIARQEETLNWLRCKAVLPGLEEYALRSLPADAVTRAGTLNDLRLAEAQAANLYFDAWRGMPVTFQKVAPGCVQPPARWLRFESRVSLKHAPSPRRGLPLATNRGSGANRDATDPINALLNFSYAVVAAETLIAVRAASLEPSLGVLHEDKDGRASLVYDLMEPLRPQVDRLVLELIASRTFKMNCDFILLREGICRLGIELAGEVGKLVSERIRAEADRMAATVRKTLLSVANVTYRVPRMAKSNGHTTPDGRPPASPKGTCCVCGVEVPGSRRYCETHRREKFSEQWKKLWAEGKVKAAQSESLPSMTVQREANRKRSDTMRRVHALKGNSR